LSPSNRALCHAPAAARGRHTAVPGKQHLLPLLGDAAHLIIVCLSQARLHRAGRTMASVGRHAKHGHPSGGWRQRRRRHTSRTGKWRPLRGLGSRLGKGWWPVRPEYRPRCDAQTSKGNEGAQSRLLLAAVKTRCATRSANDAITLWPQGAAPSAPHFWAVPSTRLVSPASHSCAICTFLRTRILGGTALRNSQLPAGL